VVGLEWYPCCRLKLQPATRFSLQHGYQAAGNNRKKLFKKNSIHYTGLDSLIFGTFLQN